MYVLVRERSRNLLDTTRDQDAGVWTWTALNFALDPGISCTNISEDKQWMGFAWFLLTTRLRERALGVGVNWGEWREDASKVPHQIFR